MRPDPNGDQQGREYDGAGLGKMSKRLNRQSITHTPFTPPNGTEGTGVEKKSGGEPGGPQRQRGKTPTMPKRG